MYGCQDRKDDLQVGIWSTSLFFGKYVWEAAAAFDVAFLVFLYLAGVANNQGLGYYLISVGGATLQLVYQLSILNVDSTESCWGTSTVYRIALLLIAHRRQLQEQCLLSGSTSFCRHYDRLRSTVITFFLYDSINKLFISFSGHTCTASNLDLHVFPTSIFRVGSDQAPAKLSAGRSLVSCSSRQVSDGLRRMVSGCVFQHDERFSDSFQQLCARIWEYLTNIVQLPPENREE